MDMSSKTRFNNRNKLRTPDGWVWLTIPVNTKSNHSTLINELKIVHDSNWQLKHFNAIKMNYSKSKYFKKYISFFEDLYNKNWILLVDIIDEIFYFIIKELNLEKKILKSSLLGVEGNKDDLILNLCKAIEGKTYISGPLGREYLDEKKFRDQGTEVIYHDYQHPVYDQTYKGFEPYMSVIDLLFNYGDDSLKILSSKNFKNDIQGNF